MHNNDKTYIDKYIASTGKFSRRKAQELIHQQKVLLNGKLAKLNHKVDSNDVIVIEGEALTTKQKNPIVMAYHKPKGIVCTTEKIKDNIIDAINYPDSIFPIGRLDKDSEGLILLTNKTDLIDKIANPKYEHEKEYQVTVNLPVRTSFLKAISEGIDIGIGVTLPAKATIVPGTKRIFNIILKQGLNRQIRKMCNVHQYQVIKLQRIRVMHVTLNNLKPGEWRVLSQEEIELFNSH
jgi:23S rRNA pseudouridine2604 synthase